MAIHRGDLVLDIDGRHALVRHVKGDVAEVRMGDGLVVELPTSDLAMVFRPGWATVNFLEEMRPDWADPLSPAYRPPPPEEG